MKRYKLLGTGNIPMSNENAYSHIENEGGELNFVLVFDSSIPIDKPLTISGDGDSEGALRKNDTGKVAEYNQALQKERNRKWKNYIQSVTIHDGETYGGFVAFKNKRTNFWEVTVEIAGKKYTFTYHK